ncbi:DNA helicase RecQ [Rubrimonas cliftonensis]|uniref:DNA helicase RecQ n=1 Tax=Rubrimonas cliftonensis TaxID=89524 RepID=A0A1H3X5F5_9RHOB|nr:DNA helicase RecQ [Rubrimonas cliftonensis]SDZ94171.1 ATP-dependent DNA helicase RecQ [Rubrimonas cliftonensis]
MHDARALLKTVFGFEDFRPGQREIVDAVINGRDVLAIMPTGGGKSLCYQLPALARDGLTVVVSPLIALMRDQVRALQAAGVPAAALTSANTPEEQEEIFDALDHGRLKLLYMAPERVAVSGPLLRRARITLLAVDEAHCVSQWGHDFRPDYLRIGDLRQSLGGVQTAAFTATADAETRAEIAQKLFDRPPETFLRGFDRPNLFLAFEPKNQPRQQLLRFVKARKGRSGIVYASSRNKTEVLAKALSDEGLPALAYHAGLDPVTRQQNQDRFQREDDLVMCATVAFGMGVDKPDIRFVAHADLPKSVESYYQEIGRAGRDGAPADTLTLYGLDDIRLRRMQIDESPAPEERKRGDHQRFSALLTLAEAPRCRRMTLLGYFGETLAEPCGACDLCRNPPKLFDATVAAQKALSAILRTGERFGMEHLIAILRGETTEKVAERGHDRLPTFGAGKEFDRNQWRGVFRQLAALGVVWADAERHGAWRCAEAARPILKGEQPLQMRADALRPAKGAGGRAAPAALVAEEDEPLLSALKARRRELAEAQGVPAYVVFADRTLIDMATAKPQTLAQLGECHGVGAKKLDQYGRIFLDVLTQGAAPPHPAQAKLSDAALALCAALEEAARDLARGEDGAEKPLSLPRAAIAKIAETKPRSVEALARVPGVGEQKARRFGAAFLAVIAAAR